MMSNKVYDVLKWVCTVVVPALIVLLVTLNSLWEWGLPIEAIVGTISAINTFIGVLLGISSANYKEEQNDKS